MAALNWMAWEAIATTALVVTSAGAISYAALQLRTERAYRSVSNLEKQLSFFLSESFVRARRHLAETRVRDEELVPWSVEEPPVAAFEVLDFYDHLGLLVRKGHLEVFDVWHTFYEWAQPVYVDLRALVEGKTSDYRDHYCELRELMRTMDDIQLKRMHETKANHLALWTPDRILDYYRYESETGEEPRRRRRRARAEAAHAEAQQAEAQQAETQLVDSEGTPIRSSTIQ